MSNKIVGLFGTCSQSTWRDKFIEVYEKEDISYFNPNVANWTPACAENEAKNLSTNDIILFPILSDSFGFGSLAEIGFAIIRSITNDRKYQSVIVLIDKEVDLSLKSSNPEAYKLSNNTRALVRAHLNETKVPDLYVVDTLEEMLEKSVELAHEDGEEFGMPALL